MKQKIETLISKMFRDEHLKELEKYSLGELIEAIESRDGISRHDVGRHEVASININDKNAIMGGYCVLFRLNETRIPLKELSSIIYKNDDNLMVKKCTSDCTSYDLGWLYLEDDEDDNNKT